MTFIFPRMRTNQHTHSAWYKFVDNMAASCYIKFYIDGLGQYKFDIALAAML